jgi:hypothetical protein
MKYLDRVAAVDLLAIGQSERDTAARDFERHVVLIDLDRTVVVCPP